MPENLVEEVALAVKEEVKEQYDKLDKKTEDMGEVIDGLRLKSVDKDTLEGHLNEIREEVKNLSKQADELDKIVSRPDGIEQHAKKSLGLSIVESDEYKQFAERKGGTTGLIEVKTITNAGNVATGQSQNVLVPEHNVPGVITPPEQPLMVRDLLPVGTTVSDTIRYVKETGFTNAAAPRAENTEKPKSDITFGQEKAPVITIPHLMVASKQVLDDAPQLRSHIDSRLSYGLKLEEEEQIMLGDGTGENLDGLIPNATSFVSTGIPHGANSNIADVARWAKLQVRKAHYPASAVVLNPEDFALLELLKDSQGNYLYSAFASGIQPRLWGMRIAESDTVPVGEFMVGAFSLAAQIWDRQQATIEVSTEDKDNFSKNMITIRAEERLALTVYRPESFVHGSLTVAP